MESIIPPDFSEESARLDYTNTTRKCGMGYHKKVTYELKLENYQGPLQKLLELIEEKKMEITIINLAEVTSSFFEYLKKLEALGMDHSLLADFLVIASKLLLIKSKVLLPSLPLTEEEESDIRGLESQLKL
ncbi:MAG: segregation/condensation protein A, partial [Patescibacteria group bacterium]